MGGGTWQDGMIPSSSDPAVYSRHCLLDRRLNKETVVHLLSEPRLQLQPFCTSSYLFFSASRPHLLATHPTVTSRHPPVSPHGPSRPVVGVIAAQAEVPPAQDAGEQGSYLLYSPSRPHHLPTHPTTPPRPSPVSPHGPSRPVVGVVAAEARVLQARDVGALGNYLEGDHAEGYESRQRIKSDGEQVAFILSNRLFPSGNPRDDFQGPLNSEGPYPYGDHYKEMGDNEAGRRLKRDRGS